MTEAGIWQERPTSLVPSLLILGCRSLAYPPDSDARAGRRSSVLPGLNGRRLSEMKQDSAGHASVALNVRVGGCLPRSHKADHHI